MKAATKFATITALCGIAGTYVAFKLRNFFNDRDVQNLKRKLELEKQKNMRLKLLLFNSGLAVMIASLLYYTGYKTKVLLNRAIGSSQ